MTNRFSEPLPIVEGEEAERHAKAWAEYDRTGDVEVLYRAGVWARPD